MSDTLLSTRQAAALLGVGTTSIKRWADEGVLACEKTVGGHRRFSRAAVLELKRAASRPAAGAAPPDAAADWVRRLVSQDAGAATAALERDRARLGAWWRVADELGATLDELGRQWETGALSVIQEHVASAHLARALARCGDRLRLPRRPPRALLMTAAGDDHTLGLSLAELCLREAGWATRWIGRRAPIDQAVAYIAEGHARLVAVSASPFSIDDASLAAQAARLGAACRARGAELVLGGAGAWPERPPHGVRARSFRELRDVLRAR
jgi:excisionase family DNA binding protein